VRSVAAVYCSNDGAALQTARIAGEPHGVLIHTRSDLRPGDRPAPDAKTPVQPESDATDPCRERTAAAFDHIAQENPDKTVLVVAERGVCLTFLSCALGRPLRGEEIEAADRDSIAVLDRRLSGWRRVR